MAFTTNFPDAAHRHFAAAECLHQHDHEPSCRRSDIAGYLYGLAAECAMKEIVRRSIQWQEPERLHFPELKAVVRENMQGRHAAVLRRFTDTSFMNEWAIQMRYARRRDISSPLVAKWREHAKEIIAAMEDC